MQPVAGRSPGGACRVACTSPSARVSWTATGWGLRLSSAQSGTDASGSVAAWSTAGDIGTRSSDSSRLQRIRDAGCERRRSAWGRFPVVGSRSACHGGGRRFRPLSVGEPHAPSPSRKRPFAGWGFSHGPELPLHPGVGSARPFGGPSRLRCCGLTPSGAATDDWDHTRIRCSCGGVTASTMASSHR